MTKYRCKACGYVHYCISIDGREQIAEKCPLCGAFRPAFAVNHPLLMKWSYHFNLFQPGWWILHLAGISLLYIIGRLVFHGTL